MKTTLLIAIAASFPLLCQSQTPAKGVTGIKNNQVITRSYKDKEASKPATGGNSTSQKNSPLNMKTAAVSASRFTGSMNVYGVLVSECEPLQYNEYVNAVTFVHRKSGTYNPASNGNSGSMVAMISANSGSTWDSTCIWAHANDLARYPQGGIYNPGGNTTITNAYILGTGPITDGSTWSGNWYASKKITAVGDNTPGADQQSKINAAATTALNKHHFSRTGFVNTTDGNVRSLALILNDPDATSFSSYGYRGAGIVKGVFNAGAFVWTMDSLIPSTLLRPDGSKYLNDIPVMAWNEAGNIGYVIFLGVSSPSTTISRKSFQPIVYKTMNSGASWALLPSTDFTTPAFKKLTDRLWPIGTNTSVIVPYFNTREGIDATVDLNGDLHLACTVIGAYSADNDSLDYTYTFQTEKYSFPQQNLGWPTVYDFYTNSLGTFNGKLIDSLFTEGPSGFSGQGGFTQNPWSDGADKFDLQSRIQISRSPNGRQIFYSWVETDTIFSGHHWNIYPDIKAKSWDVTTGKFTQRYNFTGGVTGADQSAYFHYMSNKTIQVNACGSYEIPFTITYNGAKDGGTEVNHYYINDALVSCADYSISAEGFETALTQPSTENLNVVSYPNPASDNTSILMSFKSEETISIELYNVAGQLLQSQTFTTLAGENKFDLDLSSYARGLYLCTIKTETGNITQKIVKE